MSKRDRDLNDIAHSNLDTRIDRLTDDRDKTTERINVMIGSINAYNDRVAKQIGTMNETLKKIPTMVDIINMLLSEKETIREPIEQKKEGITNKPVPIVRQCPHCEKILKAPPRNPGLLEINMRRHILSCHPTETSNVSQTMTVD